ncbi:hypothetical protein [Luteimonas sp. SDU82]|uniref:hypothetical protein n=1 Tax=Luteimonas sp. SDU82 TaxID=3422592 RepID=UPI003EB9E4E5
MGFLQGISQCWWPGPTCQVNWDAWVAISTVILGLLAWCTAVAAKNIAQRQEENAARDRDAVGQIRGRLLFHEVVNLAAHVAYTQNYLHVSGIQPNGKVKDVEAMDTALRMAASNPLQLASDQIDHLHYFPDKIGHDLATLIGAVRTMNAGAQAVLESDFQRYLGGMNYEGDTEVDFAKLSKHLDNLFHLAQQFAEDFATYLGLPPRLFNKEDYLGPLKLRDD